MKNNIIKYISIALVGLTTASCLEQHEEKLYSALDLETAFAEESRAAAALQGIYKSIFPLMGNSGIYVLQEVTSDEITVPTRGTDWSDNGKWIRIHQHDYNANDEFIVNSWNHLYEGISECNNQLRIFKGVAAAEAELKAFRGWNYYMLMDLYGNVPLVDENYSGTSPATKSRKEVFDFVVADLTAALEHTTKNLFYGRMNYWAVKMALAKVYLNAEIYTGTPMYDKAYAAIKDVVEEGPYTLNSNFYTNFVVENTGNPEAIWVIPYDRTLGVNGFNMGQMTLHYSMAAPNFPYGDAPWNGFCAVEDFFNTFDDADTRKGSFFYGDQLVNTGSSSFGLPTSDSVFLKINPKLASIAEADKTEGARIRKFEFQSSTKADMSNDFPIFRLADAILVGVEASVRGGGALDGALKEGFDKIRTRAGLTPLENPTLDQLLDERGRELFSEVHRRQDLIRFGNYTKSWWEKAASDDYKKIFPIPSGQINVNDSLVQNPGY